MIADCHQQKKKEHERGKSFHSTEIHSEDEFETFLESLNIRYEPPANMTATLRVGGKSAKTLLDTGTVGTNLMSLNWVQSNRIKTAMTEKPVEIRMATKYSRATANYTAKEEIDIGNGK